MSTMMRRVGLGVVLAIAGAASAAEPPKPRMELVLDTPHNALKTYMTGWKTVDFGAIMRSLKITDPKMAAVVDRYVNYMMWRDALERACVAKFGEDQGMKVLSHVRTLMKQYELDITKRIAVANSEADSTNKDRVRLFLRVEKDRPAGLEGVDNLAFLDEYWMIKDGAEWKVDFLRTYKLDDPAEADNVKYYASQLYPVMSRKMKELTEKVKAGKLTSADEAKAELDLAEKSVPTGEEDPAASAPATGN